MSGTSLGKYQYKDAIEIAMDLVEESKKRKNNYYHYVGHNILGSSYYDLNDTLRAKKHYEDALIAAEKTSNDTLLLGAYNNLGNIYSEDKNTTQIGIDYYNLVINLAAKLKNEEQILNPTVNIAWTYIDNKQYKRAWPYLEKSWQLYGNRKDPFIESQLSNLTGRYYLGVNNLDSAAVYFEKAVQMVEQDSLILQASYVYENYADFLYRSGKFKDAFLALERYNDYKSQIFRQERMQEIEAANIKFDVAEYQKNLEIARNEQVLKDEIIERSRETMLIMIISSIILIIILLALFKITVSRRKLISELSVKNKELVRAKEEAERLSILKTKFFSTISHELRTPLYGVIGLTSILLEDKSLSKHEEDLKSLKFSADYLLALINDVLQMNKMESNLVKLETVPLNVGDLMRSIVKSFEFTRLQNQNSIQLDIDDNIPNNLKGDPVRLSQVLMNLVGNAMKFTERGNIHIGAHLIEETETGAGILFRVKDDGLGIPESKHEVIFEEFSQLKSANYNYQGTGLGLPIVKKLLLLFDSEIHLESEEGKGSTFSFTINFPKDDKAVAPAISSNDIANQIDAGKDGAIGKTILIVDDNRINQVVTQRILEQQGFTCDISDNGALAVEKVRARHYDLILMDVNMPGISGLEATRQIRKFNALVPVVALTAVEIEEIREEILEAGMNDIIVKPYDTTVFYQVIYRNISSEVVPSPL
ncbi:response regulator [Antarcticibacterium flavum]|uniref:histidine kinase n=2 Tax=Flavobacteriaceae TaxID=49546 RepID=A0A5B7X7Q4_9FLAO|nr:hybrid sensor histidine kinase/response regulator [Antarcticibacterium sp. W02-3]QCY71467.1 response regulator [Antarcticibacterium flavum]